MYFSDKDMFPTKRSIKIHAQYLLGPSRPWMYNSAMDPNNTEVSKPVSHRMFTNCVFQHESKPKGYLQNPLIYKTLAHHFEIIDKDPEKFFPLPYGALGLTLTAVSFLFERLR